MSNNTKYIGRDITKLSNQIKRYISSLSPVTGLTGRQGQILHYIIAQHGDDVFQKDIEEEFNLRAASASGLIKVLEQDGYIIRQPLAHDARFKKLVLTSKASTLSHHANQDITRFEKKLIQNIQEDDLKTFLDVLNQMNKNMKEG